MQTCTTRWLETSAYKVQGQGQLGAKQESNTSAYWSKLWSRTNTVSRDKVTLQENKIQTKPIAEL